MDNRDVDKEIAEKVFRASENGYFQNDEHSEKIPVWKYPKTGSEVLPHYSTNISDAWKVVEWLKKNGYSFEFTEHADPQGDFIMQVWRRDMEISDYIVREVSAPLAICRAALLAVVGKQ